MITCPLCDTEIQAAEVYTVGTALGRRLLLDCEHCGDTFEVELTPRLVHD